MRPKYKKGKAVNLEGAALDALEWLDVFLKMGDMGDDLSEATKHQWCVEVGFFDGDGMAA